MPNHPNANVAAGGGTLATLIVWILGREHVALSAEEGSIIAGGISSIVLVIGRHGLRGLWRRILDGKPEPPQP